MFMYTHDYYSVGASRCESTTIQSKTKKILSHTGFEVLPPEPLTPKGNSLPLSAIIGITAGGLVVCSGVILVLGYCCYCCRRRMEMNAVFKVRGE